jgi:hypothetical protein
VELLEHETYPVPLFAIEAIERLANRHDTAAIEGLTRIFAMESEEDSESGEMVLNLKQAASKALFLIFNRPDMKSIFDE